MPIFRIHVRNRDFESLADGDHADSAEAMLAGLKGVLQIGSEEVCAGKPFFGAEISIALEDEIVERRMVAIGSSMLSTDSDAAAPEQGA